MIYISIAWLILIVVCIVAAWWSGPRIYEEPEDVRMADDSMKGVGILANDLLIVDKSEEPKSGDIVIALLNGKLLVRRLVMKNKKMEFKPENPKFKAISVAEADEIEIWGVVKNVVHAV